MKLHKIIFLTLLFLVGCKSQSQDNESQYSDPHLWYRDANKAGDRDFDVFYLIPTEVFDRVSANGDSLHHVDPFNEDDRELMRPSVELAQQIFGGDANFHSPYYSQITLESWRSVEGFDSDSYYRPWLDYLFKRGNYHIQELPFYRKNLTENVKRRFEAYRSKR